MGLIDKFLKKNKSNDNIKEITYFSTDKNNFITTKIPNHINIIKKKHNSDNYDINTYYNDKHMSNDSYFLHYPNTILNYKKKLQETGMVLEQSIINENDISNNSYSNDIIDDITNSSEYINSTNSNDIIDDITNSSECIDLTNSNEYIDSNDIIDEYIDNPVLNEKIIKIEQLKTFEIMKFYNELTKTEKKYYTPSIYSNLDL